MINLLILASELACIVFPGLVLHRAIASRLLSRDEASDGLGQVEPGDLALLGVVPGLALVGTIGTVLAIFGLFNTPVFLLTMAAVVVWRIRDAHATVLDLRDLLARCWRPLKGGNPLAWFALVIAGLNLYCVWSVVGIPSDYIDVWNHQLPLAQSIVRHRGFVMPQLDNWFYGTYPPFFNLLFAEALLLHDSFVAAGWMVAIIYAGLIAALVALAPGKTRIFALVALYVLLVRHGQFTPAATVPLNDLARACFAVYALVLAYRYFRDGRLYFIVASGLVAGAAAASKYTELQFPGLIVLTLVIASVWRRKHFTALVAFGVASIPIAIYPYVRNLLLLGNPIYPFLWGHPHMSDETMAAIVSELTSVFDPSYRGYVRDMRTAEGWIDLGAVVWRVFLDHQKYTQAAIAFLLAGSFFRRSALAIPALWSVALLLIWYQAMFNHPRWALAFHMHLIAAGYIALMWLIAEWRSVGAALPMGRLLVPAAGLLMRVRSLALPMLARRSSAMLGLGLLVALECGMTAMRVSSIGLHAAFPAWLDHRMVPGLAAGAGPQAFLEETRPGYRLYRFIGEHDLRTVFQPFDNGAFLYQAAYNNGRSNDWILPHYILPKDEGDLDSFVARNSIRYFIDRQQLTPTEHERLGPENIALARALIARLKPRSRLVLADSMGSELWAVEATAGR